jgi:hypothetical protein
MLSGLLLGSSLALAACGGSGTYQIPTVEPVVKQKPGDDLLENISGDTPAASSEPTPPAAGSSDEPPAGAPPSDSSKTPEKKK